MEKTELQAIDIDKISEEEARVHCIDIVKHAVDENKVSAKRGAFATTILIAAGIISELAGAEYVTYGLWGLGSFFACEVAQKVANYKLNKKHLEQFEAGTYTESYKEFLRLCQNYAANQVPQKSQKVGSR